jgi:hypothetical protein
MNAAASDKSGGGGDFKWLFQWRSRGGRWGAALGYVGLAVAGFAILLGTVRVKVGSPQFEMERSGSLIYLSGGGDGAVWAERAREAGPALSRYEPGTWAGYAGLERGVMEATAVTLPPRETKLRDLPAPSDGGVPLAARGQSVLPDRPVVVPEPLPAGKLRLVPSLFPLSPLGGASMPAALPSFSGELKAKAAANRQFARWQFLLRLDADGRVVECLSQNPADEDAAVLAGWLKGVVFDPKLARDGGWFAVAVRLTNQADGAVDH